MFDQFMKFMPAILLILFGLFIIIYNRRHSAKYWKKHYDHNHEIIDVQKGMLEEYKKISASFQRLLELMEKK